MEGNSMLVVAIIAGALVILNAIFMGIIVVNQRKTNAVRTWPAAAGKVYASYLESRQSGDDSGSTNYPVVQYSYQVGEKRYQGNRIAPGLEVGGSGAGSVIARYPQGAEVRVFYNPQNPAEAVLEPQARAQWVMWLVLIVIDVVLCGMAVLFGMVL